MTTEADGVVFDERKDECLISDVKNGDPGAAEALLLQYQPRVSAIATSYASSEEEAKDLTQEGLLAALSAAKSYDPSKNVPFGAFLSVCVANRLKSVKRKAGAAKDAANRGWIPLEMLEVPGGVEPETQFISDEERERIFRLAEEKLSALEKNTFYKRLEGLSAEETAGALGVSKKAAENAYSRAKLKLKAALSTHDLNSPSTEKI